MRKCVNVSIKQIFSGATEYIAFVKIVEKSSIVMEITFSFCSAHNLIQITGAGYIGLHRIWLGPLRFYFFPQIRSSVAKKVPHDVNLFHSFNSTSEVLRNNCDNDSNEQQLRRSKDH